MATPHSSGTHLPPPPGTPSGGPEPRRTQSVLLRVLGALTVLMLVAAVAVAVVVQLNEKDPGAKGPGPLETAKRQASILQGAAGDAFPNNTRIRPAAATSWSVQPENLVDGKPRFLPQEDWVESATAWSVRAFEGDREFTIHVSHQPPDDNGAFAWDCDEFTEPGMAECEEFSARTDGRRGVAVWFFNGDRDLMTHRVVVLADPEAGKPEVVASETIANLPPGTDYEEIKEQFRLSLVEMKAIVEDPDLAFPPAAEEPALPSYSTCTHGFGTPPSTCPEGLK
ncbi:MAG TPA: hypothetical protein VIR30_10985 [Nocardioides sp.]